MKIELPQIQPDVPGPDGQPGFLLIVPRDEVLDWDIRDEIVSTSRYWVQERQAWWVAAAYLHTAKEIVDRFSPPAPAAPDPISVAPEPIAAAPAPADPVRPVPRPRGGMLGTAWGAVEALFRRRWRASGSA